VSVLTDLTVRSLPQGLHFDARLTSFGIRVGKTKKTWIVIKGANRTKVSLGHYPALSLHDARRKALLALASADAPIERSAPRLFPDVLQTFLAQQEEMLRPLSLYQIKRILRRHFRWQKPLDKITHNDVASALDAIKAPSERAHALKDIRTFFNWCVPRYLNASPCVGIKKPPQKSRDRALDDDEISRVWRQAEKLGYPYGTIVRLLILTGQRSGETAALRWEWIGKDTITIPASVTKNGNATTFPIGSKAKRLIDSTPNTGPLAVSATNRSSDSALASSHSTVAASKTSLTTTCAARSQRTLLRSARRSTSPRSC
jgi:hypothetical protein